MFPPLPSNCAPPRVVRRQAPRQCLLWSSSCADHMHKALCVRSRTWSIHFCMHTTVYKRVNACIYCSIIPMQNANMKCSLYVSARVCVWFSADARRITPLSLALISLYGREPDHNLMSMMGLVPGWLTHAPASRVLPSRTNKLGGW